MRLVALLLVLVLALAPPVDAQAQGNRWERQVHAQLDRALAALRAPAGEDARILHIGPLNAEEVDTVAVELRVGMSYDVVGVCDDDCGRLEIVVATASGNDLAASRARDNLPVLRFTPTQAMSYRVKVKMSGCRMNPCWFGVAVLGRAVAPRP